MHENNNKAVIRRITGRAASANRSRNIFAVLAVILTTYMISTVFSIGISFADNYSAMNIRTAGTTASIFLSNPTAGQYDTIKELDNLKAVGTQIAIGSVSQKTAYGDDSDITILHYDESEWKNHYMPAISGISGTYPNKPDEIMLSQDALNQLGITDPRENMDITLTYVTQYGEKTDTFRLSGWFTNYENYGGGGIGIAFVSEQFCEDNGFTLEGNGRIAISVDSSKQIDVYNKLNQDVKLGPDQEFDTTFDLSGQSTADTVQIIFVIGMLALFIVLSGYLLIYNVMYISVSKDIRFYGLLKTIGTSPKQIRKIVRAQMYRLSVIGIPVGLILAAATSFLIVPKAIKMFNTGEGAMPTEVSFHPVIFIGTILFVFLTIVLSCRKPAKIAGAVSPVEASKYTGVKGKKKKNRKSSKSGKLYRMAFYNVFRDKKRAFLVFASLFMGTITLLSINGFLGSLNVQNYIEQYYPYDFRYQSLAPGEEQFDTEFMNELSSIEGITDIEVIETVYCDLLFDEEALRPFLEVQYNKYYAQEASYDDFVSGIKDIEIYGTQLVVIDDSFVEAYNKTHEDQIDIEAFRNGEIVFAANYYNDDLSEFYGNSLTLTDKGSGNRKTGTIGGSFSFEDLENSVSLPNITTTIGELEGIYVSESFMEDFTNDSQISFINFNVEDSDEPKIKSKLESLNAKLASAEYNFDVQSDVAEEFESSITTMNVLADGISIILILIGILNFINVMLTGVHSRRKELAVMESVGMTKKQIGRMLTFEGFYYALITTVIVMTLGNVILYVVADLSPQIADYAVFKYPIGLISAFIAVIFIICLSVPGIIYRTTVKESITQRLRDIEY